MSSINNIDASTAASSSATTRTSRDVNKAGSDERNLTSRFPTSQTNTNKSNSENTSGQTEATDGDSSEAIAAAASGRRSVSSGRSAESDVNSREEARPTSGARKIPSILSKIKNRTNTETDAKPTEQTQGRPIGTRLGGSQKIGGIAQRIGKSAAATSTPQGDSIQKVREAKYESTMKVVSNNTKARGTMSVQDMDAKIYAYQKQPAGAAAA
jgi:hypothetical protein